MSVSKWSTAATFTAALLGTSRAAQMSLKNNFSGQNFFSGFYYNDSATDPFNYGNIHYVTQDVAESDSLTYVNDAGNAIVKVDNTTDGTNDDQFGRNTVMIISNDAIELGDLVVMDAVHVPYGCSVWPAFWTLNNQVNESKAGEIDIFEAVNQATTGQYTLHTDDGCKQTNVSSLSWEDSTVISTDCYYKTNGNQGCAYDDTREGTAGEGYASQGGGVHAMLYDGDGIRTWFFPRDSVPDDLSSDSPDPTGWSDPQGVWPATGCNPEEFFTNQHLILNINICGSYAGDSGVFSQTCDGTCTDLVGDPTNYDNAYFEISSIKTYNGATTEINTSQSVESAAASGTGKSGNSDSTSSEDSSASALQAGLAVALCFVAALCMS